MKPLRIFTVLIVEEDNSLWHRQFGTSLKRMGHEVLLPLGVPLRDTWRQRAAGLWGDKERNAFTERLLSLLKAAHQQAPVDLLFVYLYPWQFSPALFEEATALGIPSLYFFCDNLSEPNTASLQGRTATLCWVPEVEALPQFQAARAKYLHLPMASTPDINFPVSAVEEPYCYFLGGKNPSRRRILGYVARQGIDLRIYGAGWTAAETYESHFLQDTSQESAMTDSQRFQRWLGYKYYSVLDLLKHGIEPRLRVRRYARLGEEYESDLRPCVMTTVLDEQAANAKCSQAGVTIGINEQFVNRGPRPLLCFSKLRDFEATMAGACYLTQATPDLPALFEEDKEIMTYQSEAELVDKARFLLQRPATRTQMRNAAMKRALGEHDWIHRFERAFKHLGL
ncbi:MAG: glycosyltransferase [Pseudomonadota bacterium]